MWAGFRKNKYGSVPPELATTRSHGYFLCRRGKGRSGSWRWTEWLCGYEKQPTLGSGRERPGNKYSILLSPLLLIPCQQLPSTKLNRKPRAKSLLTESVESSLPGQTVGWRGWQMDLEKHKEGTKHTTGRWFVAEPGLEPHFSDLYHHALSASSPCLLIFSCHSRLAAPSFFSCCR